MKEKVQTPELRFDGFTDDWEKRKLGELTERVTRKNKDLVSTRPLTISAQDGLVDQNEFFDKRIASKDVSGYFLVENGEFAYNKSYSNGYPWGAIKRLDKYENGVLSTLYIVFKSTDVNSNFLVTYYNTSVWYKEVSKNAAEGARNHGLLNIAPADFFKTELKIPTSNNEQEKIGAFFKQLANLIALHQRKLDLLKEQKKGYLQKMFPKNGAKVPELRFAGFADDWEERKLKELGDIQTGNTPPTSDSDNYSLDGVLWVTPTDIKSLVISNTAKKLSQVGVAKARIAKAGSILVTSIASIGKNTLLRMDAGFNQQINSLTPTSENDSYFLLTQSEKWSEKMKKTAASATMQIVNKTDFSNISTFVPVHKEEQQKIGSFFKHLDDTIALHQRKLDLLKEQKKGYLQKMFPKNGAKVPELRFAGFADDWEERKFKDNIVSIQTGTNLLGSTVNEGTPLIKMGNLQRGYFSFKKLEYLDSNSNVGSEDIVNYGDFLFNTRNTLELVGKGATWTGIGGKYAFNSNIARFKFDGIDTIFFNYLYNTQQVISQVHARAVGTTSVSAVYPRDLNSLLYYLPSIEEQQKIGSFFKQLDDTIALHQRKLDLLKEQKKGFLQKMFV